MMIIRFDNVGKSFKFLPGGGAYARSSNPRFMPADARTSVARSGKVSLESYLSGAQKAPDPTWRQEKMEKIMHICQALSDRSLASAAFFYPVVCAVFDVEPEPQKMAFEEYLTE